MTALWVTGRETARTDREPKGKPVLLSCAAQLVPTAGIVHVKQDAEALATIRYVVGIRDDFTLTGLHVLTTGTGSFVLGLAVADGALEASKAVAAGH